jgi:hypothetical protein
MCLLLQNEYFGKGCCCIAENNVVVVVFVANGVV